MYVCRPVDWSTPAGPDLVFEQSRGVKVLFPIVGYFKRATFIQVYRCEIWYHKLLFRRKVAEICPTALRLQGVFACNYCFRMLRSNFDVGYSGMLGCCHSALASL